MAAKTIHISAKCSDMFSAFFRDENNKIVGEYNGYVPAFLGDGDGDYVILEIELATGHILNYKKPTKAQLEKLCQPRA